MDHLAHPRCFECARVGSSLFSPSLYVKFKRHSDGSLVMPTDRNLVLSDEVVYASVNELSQKQRAEYCVEMETASLALLETSHQYRTESTSHLPEAEKQCRRCPWHAS